MRHRMYLFNRNIKADEPGRRLEHKEQEWYMEFLKKRTFLLLFMPISFFIILLVRSNEQIAEYVFSRGIYKWLSQGINMITRIFPFSLMELGLVVLPVIAVILLIRFLWKIINLVYKKQGGVANIIVRNILNLACIFSVVFFLFVLLAGVNYYRLPFSTYSGLDIQESSIEELYYLNLELAQKAADIREELHMLEGKEDEYGVLQLDKYSWSELSKKAEVAFHNLSKDYPILGGNYGAPKPVYFSKFMSRMNITGIFWPFTMEANVNIHTSDYSIPATMSHELAHLRGFMREDEANFIAYLAGNYSDSLEFRYSSVMLALAYAGNQLYKADSELYQKVRENYNPGMLADMREEYFYWKQFEDTVISTLSTTMNDTYLKANSQNDGVKSYGRMVDLLLAEYRKSHAKD